MVAATVLSLFLDATAIIWKSLKIHRISLSFPEQGPSWRRVWTGRPGLVHRHPRGRPRHRVSELHPVTRVPFSRTEVAAWKVGQLCCRMLLELGSTHPCGQEDLWPQVLQQVKFAATGRGSGRARRGVVRGGAARGRRGSAGKCTYGGHLGGGGVRGERFPASCSSSRSRSPTAQPPSSPLFTATQTLSPARR